MGTDLRGFALLLLVLTTTVVAGCHGLFLFPAVPLPRIEPAVPGSLGGGIVFVGLREAYFHAAPK